MTTELVQTIRSQVIELQQRLLTVSHERQALDDTRQRAYDKLLLEVIEILDLTELAQRECQTSSGAESATAAIFFKKIGKRLRQLLAARQVREIEVAGRNVTAGIDVTVLDTRDEPDKQPGDILEICCKGYASPAKTLRPPEVITCRRLYPEERSDRGSPCVSS